MNYRRGNHTQGDCLTNIKRWLDITPGIEIIHVGISFGITVKKDFQVELIRQEKPEGFEGW